MTETQRPSAATQSISTLASIEIMNSPAVITALGILGSRCVPWAFSAAVENGDGASAKLALAQALLQRADRLAAGAGEILTRRLPIYRAWLSTIPLEAIDAFSAAKRLVSAAAALDTPAVASDSADAALEAIFSDRLGGAWKPLRRRVRQII